MLKPDHLVTGVHRERLRVNQELRTRLLMLGTIGATAPFVGLFGTVAGIITGLGGFQKGQQVSFSDVAGPVSEALIVTAAGILVAVEAVILFNFFSQRANRVATEMRLLTDEFLELPELPSDSQPMQGQARRRPRRRAHGARETRQRRQGRRWRSRSCLTTSPVSTKAPESIFAEINITAHGRVPRDAHHLLVSALAIVEKGNQSRKKDEQAEIEKKSGIKINLPAGQTRISTRRRRRSSCSVPIDGAVNAGKPYQTASPTTCSAPRFARAKTTQVVLNRQGRRPWLGSNS
jgi:multisubunit Na+/H+ antiporter MnhC subunit